MNKKEFETELLNLCDKHDIVADDMGKDFFADIWQWIEEYGKQARIDENNWWIKRYEDKKGIHDDSEAIHSHQQRIKELYK